MNQQKQKLTKEEKSKIVLAILRNDRTANEIASQYGVNPNVLSRWKQTAIEGLPEIFEDKRKKIDRDSYQEQEQKIERLEKLVGQREYELDWLKKKLSIFGEPGQIKSNRQRGG